MELSLREPNSVLFEDLAEGDPFRYSHVVYMKTERFERLRGAPINSVTLSGGRPAHFLNDAKVEPLHGKFVEE